MDPSTAVVSRDAQQLLVQPIEFRGLPTPEQWKNLLAICADLIATGLLPDSIKTPAQGAIIILKGAEVGLPPVMSLTEIYVTKGRPSLSAQAIGYILNRAGCKVDFPKATDTEATCVITRPDGRSHSVTFSANDAARMYTRDEGKTIKLVDSYQYRSNPSVMFAYRALSRNAKRFCPDFIAGSRMIGELLEDDAEVDVIDVAVPTRTEVGPAPQESDVDAAAKLRAASAGKKELAAVPEPTLNQQDVSKGQTELPTGARGALFD